MLRRRACEGLQRSALQGGWRVREGCRVGGMGVGCLGRTRVESVVVEVDGLRCMGVTWRVVVGVVQILFKSRCDNQLDEVKERVASERREVGAVGGL